MNIAFFCLILGVVNDASAPAAEKEYSLIGFSQNEEVAAFKVQIQTRFDVYTDTYSLIELWRVDTAAILATFRQGRIERRPHDKTTNTAPHETLAAQNPEWLLAEEEDGWTRIRQKTRFQKIPITMNDSTLRLSLDDDVRVNVTGDPRKIEISPLPGSGIGYQPVIRLSNGQHLALGHIRATHADNGLLNAEIIGFHSPSGRKIVVLNKFVLLEGEMLNTATKPHLVALQDQPIGTISIGTFSLAQANLEQAEQIFSALHPEAMQLYKTYIGNYW